VKNCCFAAVDMGTNSFHMIIARLKSDGSIKIMDREKAMIRLGSHKGKELSFISDEETDTAVRVLRKFKKLADSYEAKFRAVATSAVREAKNKKEFIGKIKHYTGIDVEAIDGREEAELIYMGADKFLSLSGRNVLCIDIGGGSTEFINVNKSITVFADSLKLGAVRLSKHFFPDYILSDEKIVECTQYIDTLLKGRLAKYCSYDYDLIVGTSGTIEAVGAMVLKIKNHNIPNSLGSLSFRKSELDCISAKILSAKNTSDRLKIPGMEEKRADIIPAGVLILNRIFKAFNLKEMKISGYALREGIILSMMKKYKEYGQ